jgi:hypothetical protein
VKTIKENKRHYAGDDQRSQGNLGSGFQPLFAGHVGRKAIRVSLNRQIGRPENCWKALTEIAIGEINKAQIARS